MALIRRQMGAILNPERKFFDLLANGNRRALTSVSRIFLISKSKHRDLLISYCVKQSCYNPLCKSEIFKTTIIF